MPAPPLSPRFLYHGALSVKSLVAWSSHGATPAQGHREAVVAGKQGSGAPALPWEVTGPWLRAQDTAALQGQPGLRGRCLLLTASWASTSSSAGTCRPAGTKAIGARGRFPWGALR